MARIHLSGHMALEVEGGVARSKEFPGRQGREAFAYLTINRRDLVTRAALADALWGDRLPDSWGASLSAIVSKIRAVLGRYGLDGNETLVTDDHCYSLRLPPGTWVDHEVAFDAIHQAETALSASEPGRAYGPSAVAHHIARRPFLPGAEAPWIEHRREALANLLIRALECRATVYLWNQEHTLAVEAAREIIARRPFRENGYRLLMRAHGAAGNSAEALRTYEECRSFIAEELGVSPSQETRRVRDEILREL